MWSSSRYCRFRLKITSEFNIKISLFFVLLIFFIHPAVPNGVFSIINEILFYNKFKFLGLIGSKTKKNRFVNRLKKNAHNQNLIKVVTDNKKNVLYLSRAKIPLEFKKPLRYAVAG